MVDLYTHAYIPDTLARSSTGYALFVFTRILLYIIHTMSYIHTPQTTAWHLAIRNSFFRQEITEQLAS